MFSQFGQWHATVALAMDEAGTATPTKAQGIVGPKLNDGEKIEECIVCEESFTAADFSSRRSTRYTGHCPKCSLELRAILAASKGAPDESGTGGSADDGSSTSKYLTNLAKSDKDPGWFEILVFFPSVELIAHQQTKFQFSGGHICHDGTAATPQAQKDCTS